MPTTIAAVQDTTIVYRGMTQAEFDKNLEKSVSTRVRAVAAERGEAFRAKFGDRGVDDLTRQELAQNALLVADMTGIGLQKFAMGWTEGNVTFPDRGAVHHLQNEIAAGAFYIVGAAAQLASIIGTLTRRD
jgi:hypothetical protein